MVDSPGRQMAKLVLIGLLSCSSLSASSNPSSAFVNPLIPLLRVRAMCRSSPSRNRFPGLGFRWSRAVLPGGSTDGKELPKPVTGFFPLWEQNFLQTFGLSDPDQAKVADLPFLAQAIAERPKDYLQQLLVYYQKYGGIFKVCLGPKAFLIVSDPAIVRHIMAENAMNYDKGILADILEPIMGKGLIPADLETWKQRRKALVPGFHKAWLQRMMDLFRECSERLCERLDAEHAAGNPVNLEALYSSVALDIIGRAVFNHDFASVRTQSPVIDAVYGLMQEAEHRSFFPLPYWNIPILGHRALGMGPLVDRQRVFRENLALVDDCLDALISEALATRDPADLPALERRDYARLGNPSLLRFLVDMRGEEATARALRDDLMTMLIAGHETTAAMLTWATYCLLTHTHEMQAVQQEIDAVLAPNPQPQAQSPPQAQAQGGGGGGGSGGDGGGGGGGGGGGRVRAAEYGDVMSLERTRLALAEALRLYPQPPIIIRRALAPDTLPRAWGTETPVQVYRGTDIFILIWNLHRSPILWGPDSDEFRPARWHQPRTNPDVPAWRGYTPPPRRPNHSA